MNIIASPEYYNKFFNATVLLLFSKYYFVTKGILYHQSQSETVTNVGLQLIDTKTISSFTNSNTQLENSYHNCNCNTIFPRVIIQRWRIDYNHMWAMTPFQKKIGICKKMAQLPEKKIMLLIGEINKY